MHGLIAGLWSSLSGAGRFVSRVGSGLLVDFIGFDYTASIVTSLQAIIVSRPLAIEPEMIEIQSLLMTSANLKWVSLVLIAIQLLKVTLFNYWNMTPKLVVQWFFQNGLIDWNPINSEFFYLDFYFWLTFQSFLKRLDKALTVSIVELSFRPLLPCSTWSSASAASRSRAPCTLTTWPSSRPRTRPTRSCSRTRGRRARPSWGSRYPLTSRGQRGGR